MRKITPTEDTAPDDAGVTLTLTAEQLKALGLRNLPDAGATVQMRATATVSGPAKAGGDADDDADSDAGVGAQDADDDGDGAGAPPAALTLHLTGLTLTQPHKAPDKVLYGSADSSPHGSRA